MNLASENAFLPSLAVSISPSIGLFSESVMLRFAILEAASVAFWGRVGLF